MATTSLAERLDLEDLEPEPWGARLLRARERAGLTTREVATLLSPTWISKTGVYNLEHRRAAPTRKLDRARTLMLLVLYGTALDGFDITVDDAPPGVDLMLIRKLGEHYRAERAKGADPAAALGIAQSRCTELEAELLPAA